jgi:RNA polymerase sigma-70 factor (family 1)
MFIVLSFLQKLHPKHLQVLLNLFSKGRELSEISLETYQDLFSKWYEPIRNFIYFKTSDIGLAEDLAQDTFVKLWENRQKIDEKTVKSYLYTIANNLTINYHKRQQLNFKFINSSQDKVEIKNPEYLVEMKEYEERLNQVFAKLPNGCREVFLMNRIEDMKYREIAEALEISVKAVEKRMSKALGIIRSELNVDI